MKKINSRHLWPIFSVLAAQVFSYAGAFAQSTEQNFLVVADAYTQDNTPTTNYGSADLVRVQKWANITGFVRFDLSSLPSGSNVSEATLRLEVSDVNKAGDITLHKVLGPWSESGITSSNKPALGPELSRFGVTSANADGQIEIDVTVVVNQLLSDRSNDFGFALVPKDVNVWIKSRESGPPMQLLTTSGEPTAEPSLAAIQDSYTRNNTAAINHGTDTLVRVQTWGNMTGFLRFDLSTLPAGSTVNTATLRLSVDSVQKNGSISLHKVLGPWSELGLTETNKPALGPAVTSFSVTSADNGRNVEIDVSQLVNQLLANPATDFGMALVPGNVNLWLISREGGEPAALAIGDTQAAAPVARNDRFATAQGTQLNGNVLNDNGNGPDSPGQAPTSTNLETVPDHGTIAWSGNGTFSYAPDSSFAGTDRFSYSLRDGSGALSNTAQVTVAVSAPSNGKPNVLFFFADDMGWGDTGVYNPASRIDTPNIDRLASEGIYFSDAHSAAAKCAPSRYSALTGNYQWRGRWPWGQWNYKGGSQIRSGQQTLGNLLQSAGYVTAAIGKYHLGGDFFLKGSDVTASASASDQDVDFSRRFRNGPVDRGFDYSFLALRGIQASPYAYFENDQLVGDPAHLQTWLPGSYGRSRINNAGIGMPYWDSSAVGPALVEAAIDMIDGHYQQNVSAGTTTPFFLYYASQSAHGPYTPPDSLLGAQVKGRTGMNNHTDMIYEIDVALGALLNALEERGLADNTLVIFASDNGGLPNETHLGHDSVGGLRGKKGQIHEGGHRVPLIFKWGDGSSAGSIIPRGRRSDQLAAVQDVVATIAAVAGVDPGPDQALDSYNLLPLLLGQQPESQPIRTSMVIEADEDEQNQTPRHFAVRDHQWKLVFDEDRNPVELYNLETDLDESNNRVGEVAQQSRVQAMQLLLQQILSSSRSAP